MRNHGRFPKMLLTTAAMLALAPASAHAAYGLAGEWLLDETAGTVVRDSSGWGHDGRFADGAGTPTRVLGVSGFGLRFDGDDEVRMPDSAGLEPPRLTVEAWVRNAGTPGSHRYVVSKGATACNSSSYGIYTGSSQGLAFYVTGASGYVVSDQANPAAVWDGAWHHVAGTYDGQTVRLFVDGAQIGAARPAPPAIVYGMPSKNLRLGTYRGDCDLPFTGDVDTVRIWNLALTAGEVAAAPSNPQGRPPADPATPRPGTPAPEVSNAPSGSPTGSSSTAGSNARGCLSVTASKRRMRIRRRSALTVTVRRSGRRAARVRVAVRGKGIRTTIRRTDRLGRARFVVRPRRKVALRVRAYGTKARCRAPIAKITVR